MEHSGPNPNIEELMLRIGDLRQKLSAEEYDLMLMQMRAITDATAAWALYRRRSPQQTFYQGFEEGLSENNPKGGL